jgi:hypothetical protein
MLYLMLKTAAMKAPCPSEQRRQVHTFGFGSNSGQRNEGTGKIPCLALGNNRRRSLTLARVLGTAGDAKQSQHSSKSYSELLHNKVLLSAKK